MRRILLVLAVAALMAAMMVASAMPAFALGKCPEGWHTGGGPAQPVDSDGNPGTDAIIFPCWQR
jgi:hypothetical protein